MDYCKNLTCHVCNSDINIYYKDFNIILYKCNNCGHFFSNVYRNNHNTDIFKNLELSQYKINTTNQNFYKFFYKLESYLLLNIYDLFKIKNTIGTSIIYFLCHSYDNLYNSKKGSYQLFSTNSIQYIASLYLLNLNNVYILNDTNQTVYEFIPINYIESNEPIVPNHININNLIYNEISENIY